MSVGAFRSTYSTSLAAALAGTDCHASRDRTGAPRPASMKPSSTGTRKSSMCCWAYSAVADSIARPPSRLPSRSPDDTHRCGGDCDGGGGGGGDGGCRPGSRTGTLELAGKWAGRRAGCLGCRRAWGEREWSLEQSLREMDISLGEMAISLGERRETEDMGSREGGGTLGGSCAV